MYRESRTALLQQRSPCSLVEGNVEKSPSGLRPLAVIQEYKYAPHPRPSPGLIHHERV